MTYGTCVEIVQLSLHVNLHVQWGSIKLLSVCGNRSPTGLSRIDVLILKRVHVPGCEHKSGGKEEGRGGGGGKEEGRGGGGRGRGGEEEEECCASSSGACLT